jgi:hypothetical protein
LTKWLDFEKAPECDTLTLLLVNQPGVGAKYIHPSFTRGVLQGVHGLGIEKVWLPFAAPLILASGLELWVNFTAVGHLVPTKHVNGESCESTTSNFRRDSREAAFDNFLVDANSLKQL